jgi:hypothetical protein
VRACDLKPEEPTIDEAWQQQIRERALAIWEHEGRPAGDPDQFKAMAEQELVAEGLTPASSTLDEPSKRPEQMQSDEAIDGSFPASDPHSHSPRRRE